MEGSLHTRLKKYFALVICASLYCVASGAESTAVRCCKIGVYMTPQGRCSDKNHIRIDCPLGQFTLRDVILHGNKVTTKDSPGFVHVEDPKEYCVGEIELNATEPTEATKIPAAVVCFQESMSPKSNKDFEISGILTLISVVFLVLTIAVYTFLPGLRDLQGLCYLCMCISMALGFLSLGILQLSPGFKGEFCTITGFLVYFWMMAAFFWMNVISVNVLRTVIDASYLRRTENKQYAMYSCYAWGSSFFLLVVSLLTNFIEGDHWKPNFGSTSCWFSGTVETWLYFYGPIALILMANVVLFVFSSYNLMLHTNKYEVSKLNNLKRRFLLSLKLFLVMGISWIFEIASFAHGGTHVIWTIMDTVNCLQGLIIFLLLVVFRRRVLRGLINESCCLFVTRPLAEMIGNEADSDDEHILGEDLNNIEVRVN